VAERRLLAVFLDAADEALTRTLMDAGCLPALAALREAGTWSALSSPGDLGNQATYPTLLTGRPPTVHGLYGGWPWVPERMAVTPIATGHLPSIWKALHDGGASVGLLDAPTTDHLGLTNGFEVTEWAAHYWMLGRTHVSPPAFASLVTQDHPFCGGGFAPSRPDSPVDAHGLIAACTRGAAMRGDLAERLLEEVRPDVALVDFAEIHRASHDLWYTAAPDHPLFTGLPTIEPGLVDVYRAVDAQVGRLVDGAGPEVAVAVFSLVGMAPCRGVASFLLGPVLEALGYSRRGDAPRRVGDVVKAHVPAPVKRLYRRRVRVTTRQRMAAASMLPTYDWSVTRAFALPSDQHGFLRINLKGREAAGIVAPADYEHLRDELATTLAALTTTDGRPVVTDVMAGDESGPHHLLPDLVVHWADAAFDRPVRFRAPAITAQGQVPSFTGRHRAQGFCLARHLDLPAHIDVPQLARAIVGTRG
jgi:predicted AlkP superfamily phosphohydrolase/phosphomutase